MDDAEVVEKPGAGDAVYSVFAAYAGPDYSSDFTTLEIAAFSRRFGALRATFGTELFG